MKKNNQVKIIIFIGIFAIGLGVFLNFVSDQEADTINPGFTSTQNQEIDTINPRFANMTKDEAIDNLRRMRNNDNVVPDNFVPAEIRLQGRERALTLLHSHDDLDEIVTIAYDSVFAEPIRDWSLPRNDRTNAHLINTVSVGNRFVVTYIDTTGSICDRGTCYRGISFNREYLNIFREEIDNVITTELIFQNVETDFVKEAMSIILYANMSSIVNIYDYEFIEKEDSFVFTVYTIGFGLDMSRFNTMTVNNMSYAINLIEKELILDKNTGKLQWWSEASGTFRILKSIPLTDAETAELMIWE